MVQVCWFVEDSASVVPEPPSVRQETHSAHPALQSLKLDLKFMEVMPRESKPPKAETMSKFYNLARSSTSMRESLFLEQDVL